MKQVGNRSGNRSETLSADRSGKQNGGPSESTRNKGGEHSREIGPEHRRDMWPGDTVPLKMCRLSFVPGLCVMVEHRIVRVL